MTEVVPTGLLPNSEKYSRIHCNECRRPTRHELLRTWAAEEPDGTAANWQIVRCAGCETLSFHVERFSDTPHGADLVESCTYPARVHRPPKEFPGAPEHIAQLYFETIVAYNSDLHLFCAGGLRALVEAICADQGIRSGPKWDSAAKGYLRNKQGNVVRTRSLEGKIEGLAERGQLTAAQARRLHEHRFIGNRALHELEIPTRETLDAAIEILEHLADDLYTLPARVVQLRSDRGTSPAGAQRPSRNNG